MATRKPRGKPFQNGDTRINRRGRPKDHVGLRTLIQRIMWEPEGKDKLPRIELMISRMAASKNAGDHESLLKHGYGDVPKEVELSGKNGGPIDFDIKPKLIGKFAQAVANAGALKVSGEPDER